MLYVEVMYKNQISNLKCFLKIILCHPCFKKKKKNHTYFQHFEPYLCSKYSKPGYTALCKILRSCFPSYRKNEKKNRCLLSGEFLRQKKMCFPFTGGKLHIHFTPWIHVEG